MSFGTRDRGLLVDHTPKSAGYVRRAQPCAFCLPRRAELAGRPGAFLQPQIVRPARPRAESAQNGAERHQLSHVAISVRSALRTSRSEPDRQLRTVEWADNIEISDKPPRPTFPHEERVPPEQMAQMRYWHALPEGGTTWTSHVPRRAAPPDARVIRDASSSCRRSGSRSACAAGTAHSPPRAQQGGRGIPSPLWERSG